MGPSLSHVGKALAIMGLVAGLWMLGLRGPHWMGAIAASWGAWERELAQTWRSPTNPGKPVTMANIRQAGWPTLAVLGLAAAIELLA